MRFQMLKEACTPDPAAVARGAGDLRGRVLPDRQGHDLRQARGAGPALHRRRPARPRRGSPGASPTASSPPAARTRRSTPRRCCPRVREGIEKAGRSPDEVELMMEVKVSFDQDLDARAEDTRLLGCARAHARGEDGRGRPDRDAAAAPTRCRWSAPRPAGSRPTIPRSTCRPLREYVELGFTPPGLPLPRAPTRSGRSADTASTCCRGCEH